MSEDVVDKASRFHTKGGPVEPLHKGRRKHRLKLASGVFHIGENVFDQPVVGRCGHAGVLDGVGVAGKYLVDGAPSPPRPQRRSLDTYLRRRPTEPPRRLASGRVSGTEPPRRRPETSSRVTVAVVPLVAATKPTTECARRARPKASAWKNSCLHRHRRSPTRRGWPLGRATGALPSRHF